MSEPALYLTPAQLAVVRRRIAERAEIDRQIRDLLTMAGAPPEADLDLSTGAVYAPEKGASEPGLSSGAGG